MKKIIIGCLFCLLTVYTFGQDFCYYLQEEKICYEVSATRILVKSETLDITDIEDALQNPVVGALNDTYDLGDGLFLIEMTNTKKEDMWELQRQLSSREDIIYTSPVFYASPWTYPGEGYTNEVSVMLKSANDYPVLLECANVYNIEDIRIQPYSGETYILTLPHNPEKDAMQTALELYETGLFEYAQPNGIVLCAFEWCPFESENRSNANIVIPEEQTVVFYPNPVSDILYVDMENKTSASYDIRLYNSVGKMCRQAKAPGGLVELSVSNLPDGIYFLHICDSNASKPETHKVIVKH